MSLKETIGKVIKAGEAFFSPDLVCNSCFAVIESLQPNSRVVEASIDTRTRRSSDGALITEVKKPVLGFGTMPNLWVITSVLCINCISMNQKENQ